MELKEINAQQKIYRNKKTFNRTNSGIERTAANMALADYGLLIEPIVELKENVMNSVETDLCF